MEGSESWKRRPDHVGWGICFRGSVSRSLWAWKVACDSDEQLGEWNPGMTWLECEFRWIGISLNHEKNVDIIAPIFDSHSCYSIPLEALLVQPFLSGLPSLQPVTARQRRQRSRAAGAEGIGRTETRKWDNWGQVCESNGAGDVSGAPFFV